MLALRLLILMVVASAVVVGLVLASKRDGAAEIGSYACPMHPEVTATAPGTCPICGMALTSIGVADNASSPGTPPEPGEISLARRRLIHASVRAPAWVDADGELVALLYNEELAALAADERGSFFPAAAPQVGTPVVRNGDAPSPWDTSTSIAHFRIGAGTQPIHPGEVGRLVLDPKPYEVLLVPAPAVLESAEGPYVLTGSADGGAYTKQQISIGKTVGGFTAVQAGMQDEQRVVARDVFLLDAESRRHLR